MSPSGMQQNPAAPSASGREQLIHALYEAAELEHNLMCTYLYAAFSLREGGEEGLSTAQTAAVQRWRRAITQVAVEEMGHLAAVWNLTVALGGAPRFGRMNFPLDPGYLPAGIIVKLAPFNSRTLQHFIFLERPNGSQEPEGEGFTPERLFQRGHPSVTLTPMAMDYDTVGTFYAALKSSLIAMVERDGEAAVFRGGPEHQLAGLGLGLSQVRPIVCLKTALAAIDSIVAQGEGSPADAANSHFNAFLAIRSEMQAMLAAAPDFSPAFPAATNPVLRRPPRPEGRVWIEDPQAVAVVDLANASYGLMLRLLAYSYALPGQDPSRVPVLELCIGLMRAMVLLGEQAARLPAGPFHHDCHAGMSFTALRDAAAFPVGPAAEAFFSERLIEFQAAARLLAGCGLPRLDQAAGLFDQLATRAASGLRQNPGLAGTAASIALTPAPAALPDAAAIEVVTGGALEIHFQARRCIHARFCVTGAPQVFLANVPGAWIHPDAMPAERLVEIAHACPSGAIQYRRLDGQPDESPPPVNLASLREGGPYAFRGDLKLPGAPAGFRATLCRCGASRNKPFCDGSHHEAGFAASGEPPTVDTTPLAERGGPLQIDPLPDGPLQLSGNLEITSGTGRVLARVQSARLCRCGGSQSKPFCDNTHARIGFRSAS